MLVTYKNNSWHFHLAILYDCICIVYSEQKQTCFLSWIQPHVTILPWNPQMNIWFQCPKKTPVLIQMIMQSKNASFPFIQHIGYDEFDIKMKWCWEMSDCSSMHCISISLIFSTRSRNRCGVTLYVALLKPLKIPFICSLPNSHSSSCFLLSQIQTNIDPPNYVSRSVPC